MATQRGEDRCPGLVGELSVACDALEEVLGAEVAGHDDDGVAEVDGPALRVGEPAVVQHLEQDVEHIGVGLFDLVEQQHRVGLAPYRLGELAALLVADVAGRRSDEPGDGVPFLVFAHVGPDQVLVGVEQRGGERLGQLGLADAGRAEEEERADRAARVADPGAGPDDRVGDRLHRLVLPDDPFVQDLVEPQQFLPLAFEQPAGRDVGPAGHHLRDLVRGHHLAEQPVVALLGDESLLFGVQLAFQLR